MSTEIAKSSGPESERRARNNAPCRFSGSHSARIRPVPCQSRKLPVRERLNVQNDHRMARCPHCAESSARYVRRGSSRLSSPGMPWPVSRTGQDVTSRTITCLHHGCGQSGPALNAPWRTSGQGGGRPEDDIHPSRQGRRAPRYRSAPRDPERAAVRSTVGPEAVFRHQIPRFLIHPGHGDRL